jgi:hypothetical protein
MADDDIPLDLKLARAPRDEAEQYRQAAEKDLEAARYERGQIEHAKRFIEQTEKGVAERERRLAELNESELVARENAAAAKLKQAEELMAQYRADYHQAAISLNQIDAREKAELAAAGIGD